MSTECTLVPLHYHVWLGTNVGCAIVRIKKSIFGSFRLRRANSMTSMRHRLALYPITPADPSYHIMKELSQFDKVYAS